MVSTTAVGPNRLSNITLSYGCHCRVAILPPAIGEVWTKAGATRRAQDRKQGFALHR